MSLHMAEPPCQERAPTSLEVHEVDAVARLEARLPGNMERNVTHHNKGGQGMWARVQSRVPVRAEPFCISHSAPRPTRRIIELENYWCGQGYRLLSFEALETGREATSPPCLLPPALSPGRL
jgi:hypothetical protein